jgi:hypothetical protein
MPLFTTAAGPTAPTTGRMRIGRFISAAAALQRAACPCRPPPRPGRWGRSVPGPGWHNRSSCRRSSGRGRTCRCRGRACTPRTRAAGPVPGRSAGSLAGRRWRAGAAGTPATASHPGAWLSCPHWMSGLGSAMLMPCWRMHLVKLRAARRSSWLPSALVVAVALLPRLATPLDVPPRPATASARASMPISGASRSRGLRSRSIRFRLSAWSSREDSSHDGWSTPGPVTAALRRL